VSSVSFSSSSSLFFFFFFLGFFFLDAGSAAATEDGVAGLAWDGGWIGVGALALSSFSRIFWFWDTELFGGFFAMTS
jgi:hypothetical protein